MFWYFSLSLETVSVQSQHSDFLFITKTINLSGAFYLLGQIGSQKCALCCLDLLSFNFLLLSPNIPLLFGLGRQYVHLKRLQLPVNRRGVFLITININIVEDKIEKRTNEPINEFFSVIPIHS